MQIISNGIYIPKKMVENSQLADKYEVTPEYIYKRTGILKRYWVENETVEYMATMAAKQALEKAYMKASIQTEQIDLIIVASSTSKNIMPGISYLVQKELGIKNCMCFDILAGCNGYVNAFDIARNYIEINKVKIVLVIGTEVLSKVTQEDISTQILFGDGAGATIVTGESKIEKSLTETNKNRNEKRKVYYSKFESDGSKSDLLKYDEDQKLKMDGVGIYKYAVTQTTKIINEVLEQTNQTMENIKYIVPHQSNIKIIKGIADRLKVDINKFYINIQNVGNTFCASIPIALNEMQDKKLLNKGDKIILLGYGGGLNTGCILLEI